MDELEAKIVGTLETLRPSDKRTYIRDWMATAALAAVGALAFWYAMQATKPRDVLENVRILELEVADLKQELLAGTRPADVLIQVTALQQTVIEMQNELSEISQRIKEAR